MKNNKEKCFYCNFKKKPEGMSAVGDMICGITGLSIYKYHPYSIAGSCPDWCPKRRGVVIDCVGEQCNSNH